MPLRLPPQQRPRYGAVTAYDAQIRRHASDAAFCKRARRRRQHAASCADEGDFIPCHAYMLRDFTPALRFAFSSSPRFCLICPSFHFSPSSAFMFLPRASHRDIYAMAYAHVQQPEPLFDFASSPAMRHAFLCLRDAAS